VIGDLASFPAPDGSPLPGVAPVAIQMGKAVAKNIARDLARKPRENFHYFDKGSMATIGRAAAVAMVREFHFSGLIAWLAWLFVHILYLIGFRNRIMVITQWAWAYLRFESAARLITQPGESS
jgi:NADH dehydrogenase